MSIRVAVADDHQMVIIGLKEMLSNCPGITLIFTCENGIELIRALEIHQPDVLLLDIQMPGMTGDELVPVILKKYPKLHIIALTNFSNIAYINNMLKNGAKGYLLKNSDQDTLMDAIEAVHAGQIYLMPGVEEKLQEFRQQIKPQTSRVFITQRERDILALIMREFSSVEIARELHISPRTVENYRLNLCLKLEVKNTAGLVRKVIEMGLLSSSEAT